MRNETLKKKLTLKKHLLLAKRTPIDKELALVTGMLDQIEAFEKKASDQAQKDLGLSEEEAA